MALTEVLLDQLRDMYSAENQLVKALPKLARGAKNKDLKQLFKDHLDQTRGHVLRLREVFEHLGKKPTGQHCKGMEGIVAEGQEALEKDEEGASFDAGIVGAALRTEHYEIAGYNACIAMAKTLGEREIVGLLKQNLDEEIAAAKKVTAAGQPILKESARQPEDDQPKKPKTSREKTAARKSKQDERKAAPDVKGTRVRSATKAAAAPSDTAGTATEGVQEAGGES